MGTKAIIDVEREVLEAIVKCRPAYDKKVTEKIRTTQTIQAIIDRGPEMGLDEIQIGMATQAIRNELYYRKLLDSYHRRREEVATPSEETLTNEPCLDICRKFLKEWEERGMANTAPRGGNVPGYTNQGPQAVRQVLADLSQEPGGKRQVS